MPLAIKDLRSRSGGAGTPGAGGANGRFWSESGEGGGHGGSGRLATYGYGGTLTGDVLGNDSVVLGRTTFGGNAAYGGKGGSGNAAESRNEFSGPPEHQTETTRYLGGGGDGGAGGSGGNGGDGTTRFTGLHLFLGGAASGGSDTVWLTGYGYGGAGSGGGGAGEGGFAGSQDHETYQHPTHADEYVTLGGQGGAGGKGGHGGIGGDGRVAFDAVEATGNAMRFSIYGAANGSVGGNGGNGGGGGEGATGGRNGNGGTGGAGGSALSEITGLSIHDATGVVISLELAATGAQGGAGGGGGYSGSARSFHAVGEFYYDAQGAQQSGSFRNSTWHYTPRGAGGNGGSGGNATAQILDAHIALGNQADSVSVRLTAAGGAGGAGGVGGQAFPSSSTTSGIYTETYVGVPAGHEGGAGLAGLATVAMERDSIALGGGNDTLTLDLSAGGPRAVVVFDGNTLDGGSGTDVLAFGGATPAVVDISAGTLALGGSLATSTIAGFESFRGGAGADRFIDGHGAQTYDGGAGADRFEFTPGHGHDSIAGFAAGDVIDLKGFGSRLDSFAEVRAAATQTAAGTLIATSAGTDIMLTSLSTSTLTADMFNF